MRSLVAFFKKELLATIRSGRLIGLLILFASFGVMNVAVTILTPWLMELLSDTLSESGMTITAISVDAFTLWGQFFKNISMALIAYVLIVGNTFTKEYGSGTMILLVTKGLKRYKTVVGKLILLFAEWTVGYWLCVATTYVGHLVFWSYQTVPYLALSTFLWWLFGAWIVCLLVFFSTLMRNYGGVLLGVGGVALITYVLVALPKIQYASPVYLTNAHMLSMGVGGTADYLLSIILTVVSGVVCLACSVPLMNRKQL